MLEHVKAPIDLSSPLLLHHLTFTLLVLVWLVELFYHSSFVNLERYSLAASIPLLHLTL